MLLMTKEKRIDPQIWQIGQISEEEILKSAQSAKSADYPSYSAS
jgi:hypothetical protein